MDEASRKSGKKTYGLKKKKDGRRGGYPVFLNLSFPQKYIHRLTAVDLPSFNIHRSQGFQAERRGKWELWEVISLLHMGREGMCSRPLTLSELL